MSQDKLLSEREELRGLRLAQKHPESAPALQELIEKVKARAVEVVLKDLRVAERLKGVRFQVVGGDLREEKPRPGETSRRLGEVGIYDYTHNLLVVAILDLRAGTVIGIEERSGLQPSLTAEEIEEAKRIILSNPQFRSLKRNAEVEIVAFPARAAFTESHPSYGHRCFTLNFWRGGKQPRKAAVAVVDLSTKQLLAEDVEPSFAPEVLRQSD